MRYVSIAYIDKAIPVVNLIARIVEHYTVQYLSLFCMNQWEEEKYFILFHYIG
jgi:hypothetical protein